MCHQDQKRRLPKTLSLCLSVLPRSFLLMLMLQSRERHTPVGRLVCTQLGPLPRGHPRSEGPMTSDGSFEDRMDEAMFPIGTNCKQNHLACGELKGSYHTVRTPLRPSPSRKLTTFRRPVGVLTNRGDNAGCINVSEDGDHQSHKSSNDCRL
jgi:hypothetical protein